MYQREAFAVASNYGFTTKLERDRHSSDDNRQPLSWQDKTCFQVTIQKRRCRCSWLESSRYRDTGVTLNGSPAGSSSPPLPSPPAKGGPGTPACITALGQTGVVQDLTVNGGPNSNMAGCAVASSGDATCHGHAIGGTIASYAANGDTNDCAANGNDLPDPATPSRGSHWREAHTS